MSTNKKDLILRDYQTECLDAINAAGAGNWLIVMATGLGKTATFTHIADAGRTLILSHRDELVRQPEEYYPDDVTFGVEKAKEKAGDEQIISASVQSMTKDNRLARYAPDAFDTIIVDESHHAVAPSYRKILDHFSGARRTLGFTATPQRGDGEGLSEVFDKIIFSRDLKWGITNGYLSRIRCKEVEADYDINKVKRLAGDLSEKDLERALLQSQAIGITARAYVEQCHNKGRHTLIYCVTRAVAASVVKTIKELLPDDEKEMVVILTGETPDDERRQILADFMNDKIKCIVNCMVLTEGTDLPVCDTVINLRPTCSPGLYQQMVGRCVRLFPGKKYALVVDILPKDDKKDALMTAPSLFGIKLGDLDEGERDELDKERTDLLSFCEDISGTCLALAETVELKIRTIDLFVDEMTEYIEEAKTKGIGTLAKRLIKMDKESGAVDEKVDAHGMVVTTQADEAARYKIRPSWNEMITISEPDVLGSCKINVKVLDDPFDRNSKETIYTGTMSEENAWELARKFCENKRLNFSYMWDKAKREQWGKNTSTKKQQEMIEGKYRTYGVNKRGLTGLSKLEATVLIDDVKELQGAQKTKDSTTGSAKREEKDIRELAKDLYKERKSEGGTITVPLHISGRIGNKPSAAQISFIEGLLVDIAAGGDVVTGIDTENMRSRQASGLISILKEILKGERGGRVFEGIMDKVERFELMSPREVKIEYRFKDQCH